MKPETSQYPNSHWPGRLACLLWMALFWLPAQAVLAQDAVPEDLPASSATDPATDPAAPPPLPPKVSGEEIEPTVEIRRVEDKLVEEYSLNGQIYMVKVTPKNGRSYYYMDEDGDGRLELQPGDEAMNPVRPVYWKIKEWK